MVRTSDGNTTNLFNHLMREQPKQYAESQTARGPPAAPQPEAAARPKQTTLTQAFDKGTPYENTSKRWKEVTEAVTFYLAKDMVLFKTVENEGFSMFTFFAHVGKTATISIKICSERLFFFLLLGLFYIQKWFGCIDQKLAN